MKTLRPLLAISVLMSALSLNAATPSTSPIKEFLKDKDATYKIEVNKIVSFKSKPIVCQQGLIRQDAKIGSQQAVISLRSSFLAAFIHLELLAPDRLLTQLQGYHWVQAGGEVGMPIGNTSFVGNSLKESIFFATQITEDGRAFVPFDSSEELYQIAIWVNPPRGCEDTPISKK